MELKDREPAGTLAHRLGDTNPVSGLAIRLARERSREPAPGMAVENPGGTGRQALPTRVRSFAAADNPAISDEQIGVALCLGQMPDDPWFIRIAAQFLPSPQIDAQHLARLAQRERVEPVLLPIAAADLADAAEDLVLLFRRVTIQPVFEHRRHSPPMISFQATPRSLSARSGTQERRRMGAKRYIS